MTRRGTARMEAGSNRVCKNFISNSNFEFEFESAQNQSCTAGGSPSQGGSWGRLCDQHKPLLLQCVPHVWVEGEPAEAGPEDGVADCGQPVHGAVPLEVLEQGHGKVVVGLPLQQPHRSSVVRV